MTPALISLVAAYLLGGVPTGYIAGKLLRGIDIRSQGSGNVGATNAMRVLGPAIGVPVMLLDIGKGLGAIMLGRWLLAGVAGADYWLLGVGAAAIFGHIFTIFLRFRGGKGVATSAGVFAGLTPIPFLIALAVFALVVALSRYVSLGSILSVTALFAAELVRNITGGWNELHLLAMTFLIAVLIIVKHKANIKRLVQGNENRLNFSQKEK
ncbi:MAG: glycerol-3-phosphate 1-O-acyltransferase PlsY [Candidatus Cloacimonetes bacterium]|nr:glycerol-3-phosphate 1-O-acyltransferase PlsY [Candidatus Cloacimonadota bacterium]